LVAIVGSVGAGKSSFLLSLLEELQIIKGKLEIKGSVFYLSQEPWVFTSSIKQNILFGMPYDEKKFKKIIKICCLEQVFNKNSFYFFCNLVSLYLIYRISNC
jgi:ABC-type transport system involved in cytochrome bd biosynthesis fused ATPase/permease subunit